MAPRRVWVGFAALCLFSASEWIAGQYRVSSLAALTRVALSDGLLTVLLAAALPFVRPLRASPASGPRARTVVHIAVWGACLFGLPVLLNAGAEGHVDDLMTVLIFTLAPVVVVFVTAQQRTGFGLLEDPLTAMLPGLAGVGGAALLIPFNMPPNLSGRLWLAGLVASAVLAGVAAVRLHRLLADAAYVTGALCITAASSVLAAGFGWAGLLSALRMPSADLLMELGWIAILNWPVLLLAIWLLRRMPPVRFSTRYLLVPLVTIVESFVLLRPGGSWVTLAGLAMMGGATGLLWRDPQA